MAEKRELTLDKIYHASYVLKDVIRKTEMIHAPELNSECEVYLKTENLQVTGSFKVRGAYYKISQLSEEEKACGVVASSAGNHAQGVALAAAKNGISSLICIPDSAPISKVEATKSYGAEVELVSGAYDDSYKRALDLVEEQGRTLIHPFDDPDVIAGQGTIGLEILDQLKDVDVVLVPIGGGGLISGVAYAIKRMQPNVKVYGVQAAGAPSMLESIRKKEKVTLETVDTFADGIAVKHPGDLTYELVSSYVDDIVTVTDDEVANAILAMIEERKLIAEGAGAVSVAAAMYNKVPLKGKKVCCVVSGGNIDVNILSKVIERGLVTAGRNSNITIALTDKPGQLEGVSRIIAQYGGNVVSVHHDRGVAHRASNACFLRIGMETRNGEQAREICKALREAGFHLV